MRPTRKAGLKTFTEVESINMQREEDEIKVLASTSDDQLLVSSKDMIARRLGMSSASKQKLSTFLSTKGHFSVVLQKDGGVACSMAFRLLRSQDPHQILVAHIVYDATQADTEDREYGSLVLGRLEEVLLGQARPGQPIAILLESVSESVSLWGKRNFLPIDRSRVDSIYKALKQRDSQHFMGDITPMYREMRGGMTCEPLRIGRAVFWAVEAHYTTHTIECIAQVVIDQSLPCTGQLQKWEQPKRGSGEWKHATANDTTAVRLETSGELRGRGVEWVVREGSCPSQTIETAGQCGSCLAVLHPSEEMIDAAIEWAKSASQEGVDVMLVGLKAEWFEGMRASKKAEDGPSAHEPSHNTRGEERGEGGRVLAGEDCEAVSSEQERSSFAFCAARVS